jgi:hypothetical protein
MNFSRFSAVFDQYRLSGAQKFVSDAPFADNFRVFTQSGWTAAVPDLLARDALHRKSYAGLIDHHGREPLGLPIWAAIIGVNARRYGSGITGDSPRR